MKKILFLLFAILIFTIGCNAPPDSIKKQNGDTLGASVVTRSEMINADVLMNLEYWYDNSTGICYAMIVSNSYAGRYILSITTVPYINVKLSGVNVHNFRSSKK